MYELDIYIIMRLTLLRPLSLLMLVMWVLSLDASHRKKAQKSLMFLGFFFVVLAVKTCFPIFAIGHALGTQGIGKNEAIFQSLWLINGHVLFSCLLMLSGLFWFFMRNGICQYKACLLAFAGLLIVFFNAVLLFVCGV